MQTRPFRLALAAALLASLAACNSARDLDQPTVALGDFYFGHNIVVAENATRGPLSREASAEEWEEAIRIEMDRRFRRFDGDRLYHLAIGVDGYVLAMPGVPVVAAPKSALIFGVTVWDDAASDKINERPHRITVLETLGGDSLVGSGLTRSREEQMQDLAQNAARAVENWLRENIEWFERPLPEEAEPAEGLAGEAREDAPEEAAEDAAEEPAPAPA